MSPLEKVLFETEIPVRITDLNYGNHLGNDSLVSILHEARMHFLNNIDASELDFFGVSLIMSDLAVEYKGEAFYGDTLNIKMEVGSVHKVGFDLFYEFHNKEKLLARAKTGMICFDYSKRKVQQLPGSFIRKVQQLSAND